MFRILVVCTANICRSPASQAFLAAEFSNKDVEIDSAGTLAIDGNRADFMIQSLMEERGYPQLAFHRSRALMPSHLNNYDLILCMERSHVEYIRKANLTSVGKCMLLSHWDGAKNVADPFGQSLETYAIALDEIQKFSAQWAKKMTDIGFFS